MSFPVLSRPSAVIFVSQIGGYELDLPQFSRVVKQFGGLQKVTRLFFDLLSLNVDVPLSLSFVKRRNEGKRKVSVRRLT